ncbi:hypothetical protein D9C73_022661 [Collichthys lucidus]|uniref:Uncharacterized protein n=1 Tax=Collichthys lucidus TaxID=240159 RepID=A0A4U5VKP8_COLLU|nr:hypothetical protein D9C73_022661 [Collichthys lucidus]
MKEEARRPIRAAGAGRDHPSADSREVRRQFDTALSGPSLPALPPGVPSSAAGWCRESESEEGGGTSGVTALQPQFEAALPRQPAPGVLPALGSRQETPATPIATSTIFRTSLPRQPNPARSRPAQPRYPTNKPGLPCPRTGNLRESSGLVRLWHASVPKIISVTDAAEIGKEGELTLYPPGARRNEMEPLLCFPMEKKNTSIRAPSAGSVGRDSWCCESGRRSPGTGYFPTPGSHLHPSHLVHLEGYSRPYL